MALIGLVEGVESSFEFESSAAKSRLTLAAVAQLVERVLGKDEVMGPNPISSSCSE